MKKILSLFVLLSLCTAPVLAIQQGKAVKDNDVIAPKWSEFCPSEYLGEKPLTSQDGSKMGKCHDKRVWVNVLAGITVIPALYCIGEGYHNQMFIIKHNQSQAYWDNRKQRFDSAIATCVSSPIAGQAGCYMQVRQLEEQRNNQLTQNTLAQKQLQSQSYSNLNQTLQGIQMNNSLNKINNNLKYGY